MCCSVERSGEFLDARNQQLEDRDNLPEKTCRSSVSADRMGSWRSSDTTLLEETRWLVRF